MNQKWNLQDIRPAEPRKNRSAMRPTERPSMTQGVNQPRPVEREEIPNIVIEDGTKKDSRRIVVAVILFFVIVGGALGISAVLGKTELTVHPEFREPNISSEFIAYPDKRSDSLSYEIITLEATSESQIAASGEIQVQEQTKGVIEIIKTTPGAERLIANTRFRTPEGLVFRIAQPVVVPGAITDNSGTSVPGSIQAEVVADKIGEEYNIAAGVRFDVPGFEESGLNDLYKAIYAQSRDAFTGGFDGPQFKIDEASLATARQALQVALRNQLLERVEKEKPTGFVTFPGAVAITYNQLPAVEYGEDLVTIREQAILQVPLFKASEFGSFLAKEAVATYSGGPVRVDDISTLTFEYTAASTSFSVIANEPSLSFRLTGKPLLIWEYDAEKLRTDLAGLPKTAINNAITAYPAIKGAKVSVTPFWKRSFPSDPQDIVVIEELKIVE
jgi:hypothetical protein